MMRGCVTQPRKTDKIQPTVIYDLAQDDGKSEVVNLIKSKMPSLAI